MATHRISILGMQSQPYTGGSVYWQPAALVMTNDRWNPLVLTFADTSTRIGIYGVFNVPKNYVGSPKIIPVWTSSATSGNVVWDLDYRSVGGDNAESFDQTGQQQQLTATDAAPGAAWRRLETALNMTAGDLAVDDTVEYFFGRDGADASDTMAAAAVLVDLLFEYTDA